MNKLSKYWKSYKYRFVPWISYSLKERTVRTVENAVSDKVISDIEAISQIRNLTKLLALDLSSAYEEKGDDGSSRLCVPPNYSPHKSKHSRQLMKEACNFTVEKCESILGGQGVKVSAGEYVPKGKVVCLYPGVVYLPHQPVLFQSLANAFIFRCEDRVLIDGKDRGVSRLIFKSCVNRDMCGPLPIADISWMTPYPNNPMSVGQYVNNQSKGLPANVAYQELQVPSLVFPVTERGYLPNTWYKSESASVDLPLRVVALVSIRDIEAEEELFANYFTIIK